MSILFIMEELRESFTWYLYFMTLEAVIYTAYISRCLSNNNTGHRLYRFSVYSLAILLGEIIRAALLLQDVFIFAPKHVVIFGLELIPFSVVTYEIIKKYLFELHEDIRTIWTLDSKA